MFSLTSPIQCRKQEEGLSYLEYGYQSENQDEVILKDLMRTNGFNEADLKENRCGRMSSVQMMRLSAKAILPIIGLGVPLVGLVVMAFLAYEFYPMIMAKVRLMITMGKYIVVFFGALVFGAIALVINFILHSERLVMFLGDLASGKVASEVGRLHTSKGEEIQDGIDTILRRTTVTYNYVIKGQFYQVNERAFEALRDSSGTVFRVYFTPKSHFLLSIEPGRVD
jgi:hypothetical protein